MMNYVDGGIAIAVVGVAIWFAKNIMPRYMDSMENHTTILGQIEQRMGEHNTISREASKQISADIGTIKDRTEKHEQQMERLITIHETLKEAVTLPRDLVAAQQELTRAIIDRLDSDEQRKTS